MGWLSYTHLKILLNFFPIFPKNFLQKHTAIIPSLRENSSLLSSHPMSDLTPALRMSSPDTSGNLYRDPSGLQRTILAVVQAQFPQLLSGTNTTVSSSPPSQYSVRGSFNTDTRELKLADFYGSQGNTAWATKTSQGASFTTADVMDAVNVILHEGSHAQRKTPASTYFKGIPETEQARAAKIGSGDAFGYLPSIRPDKLTPEELVANAYAITQMKQKGMVVPGSQTAIQSELLDKMFKEVPALQEATTKALQESTKNPVPGIAQKLLDLLK